MANTKKRMYVCARLSPDEHAEICAVAEMESDSKSGVLKKALKWFSASHGKPAPQNCSLFLPKGVAHLRGKKPKHRK